MINVPEKVKQALRDGRLKKNYRFVVYDNDSSVIKYTINNENLVKESVKIDERMVTGNELKFGLCEGSVLEFQYFGLDNIRECRIQAFIYVQCQGDSDDVSDWISIPMGWYDVKECPMQASTGIYKVTAVNKLKSDYLDVKANDVIEETIAQGEDGSNSVSLYKILQTLLDGYSIESYEETQMISHPTESGNSYNGITIKKCDSQGGPSNYAYHVIYFVSFQFTASGWSQEDYYRGVLFTATLGEHIRNIIRNKYTNETGVALSLMGYANSSYAQSRRVGGCIGGYSTRDIVFSLANTYNNTDTGYHTNMPDGFTYTIPVICRDTNSSSPSVTPAIIQEMNEILNEWIPGASSLGEIYKRELSPMEKYRIESGSITSDVTLRDLQSAVYETICQYGKLDRETDLFSGIELNNSRLLPADNLYPANSLYPSGTSEHPMPSQYSKLWTDSAGVQKFRYLIITYKGLEGEQGQEQEVEKILQRTVNNDGNVDYNMSDNWLFRNLIWTNEDVGDYADAMVAKMRDIRWFPFEMWGSGLPYLETGDEIEITVGDETNRSYILTRQLKGIHNLQDQYINGTLDIF